MVGFSLSKKKKQLSFARHKFLDRIQKLQSRNYRHDLCLRIKRILTLDNSTALGADERKKPPTEGAGNRNLPCSYRDPHSRAPVDTRNQVYSRDDDWGSTSIGMSTNP